MFTLKAPSPSFLGVLQTVARSATDNWKIQVKWNGSQKSFTDCRTEIQIGWSTDWVMEGCSNLAEWTAAMKGITEHEIAHNLFSNSSEIRGSEVVWIPVIVDYFEKLRKDGMSKEISGFIRGALEDGRVNRLHVNMSPAMIQALRWVNELHYEYSCRVMKEDDLPLAWTLNSFLERTRCGKDLENVPEDTVRFLDSIQNYIEEGLFATSSSDVVTKSALPIAEAFIDEYPSLFVPAHLLPKIEHGTHRPSEDSAVNREDVPNRGLDVRVKPKLKPEKETPGETVAKPTKVVGKPKDVETKEATSPNDDLTDEGKPEFEELSASDDGELPCELTKETSNDDSVSEEEEPGSGEFEESEPDDFHREESSESDRFDDDDKTEPAEGSSDELSDEVSEPVSCESLSEEEQDGVSAEDVGSEEKSEESGEWIDGQELEHSPSPIGDDGTTAFGIGGDESSDDRALVDSVEETKSTEDEAKDALEKISNWAEAGSEVEEGNDFSELFSASEEEAIEFSTKDEAMEREVCAAREIASEFEKVDKRLFSVGIHSKVSFQEVKIIEFPDMTTMYMREREKVNKLIEEASDALREYLVRQKRSAQRNLRSGRIDPRRLWRASGSMLDSRVFMERDTQSPPTDVAVYLLLDMSASMSGGGKIDNARKAAIILSEMLEEFGVAHTVVAFTADGYSNESVEHYRLVRWGEKEKHQLMFYHAARNNRDGYSLRVATEELSKRPEKAKILIMLSDGLPEAANYVVSRKGFNPKDRVLNDVAAAVDESIEKKVEVLHLYFGGTSKETLRKVAFMYPKLSVITNPVDVPSAVADIVVSTLRKYM